MRENIEKLNNKIDDLTYIIKGLVVFSQKQLEMYKEARTYEYENDLDKARFENSYQLLTIKNIVII